MKIVADKPADMIHNFDKISTYLRVESGAHNFGSFKTKQLQIIQRRRSFLLDRLFLIKEHCLFFVALFIDQVTFVSIPLFL